MNQSNLLACSKSVWRWSSTQSLCSSCTSRRAPSMPESFHSGPHMWRALVFNAINHRGGLGSREGGLCSLDWTFDSAFWLGLRLVTVYLDDWIQKQRCEASAWLQFNIFSLSSSYSITICGFLCNLFHSITPVKQACLQQLQEQPNVTPEQVASSTGEPEIPRDGWLAVIEQEWTWNRSRYVHNSQPDLLALKKRYCFSAKHLVQLTFHFNRRGGLVHSNSADSKTGMWIADILLASMTEQQEAQDQQRQRRWCLSPGIRTQASKKCCIKLKSAI